MSAETVKWERLFDTLTDTAVDIVFRIILAIIVYAVGRFVINRLLKGIRKLRSFRSIDPTAEGYILNFTRFALYTVLVVSIVSIMGVPMSSVIAALASIGVAVGMAMQGSLSNVAGGIMLLLFRPFSVGDYIICGGLEGTVRTISLVYTVLTTIDNMRISIPNGTLMNSSIINTTAEPLRRVDLSFDIAVSEPADKVRETILAVIEKSELALDKPEPQVVPVASVTDGRSYVVRVWTRTQDYWDFYYELMQEIPEAINKAGIRRPAAQVSVSSSC